MRWLARVEGPAFSHVQRHLRTRQQQILRLRARPTRDPHRAPHLRDGVASRKISGSEKRCGRSAQDDSMRVFVIPVLANQFVMNTLHASYFLSIPYKQSIQSTDFTRATFFSRTLYANTIL